MNVVIFETHRLAKQTYKICYASSPNQMAHKHSFTSPVEQFHLFYFSAKAVFIFLF